MFGIEAIAGLVGTIVPGAFKLIGRLFGKKQDDPQEMIASLAESKPEVLPEYIKGLAELYKARGEYFNRDVIKEEGQPGVSSWVKSLRAAIRPVTVALSLVAIIANAIMVAYGYPAGLDPATRAMLGGWVGTWMGDRIEIM